MFNYQKDFPAHLLIGKSLDFVGVSWVQMNLSFSSPQTKTQNVETIDILVMGDYLLKSIGAIMENNIEAATPLCRLLGKEVIAAKVNSPTELQIDFIDDTLFIYDDSDHYESMTFKHEDKLIVV